MRRGDHGADVTTLQLALIDLGYGLPRFGADGALGEETLKAAAQFLTDHGQPLAEVPDEITAEQAAKIREVHAATQHVLPVWLVDRRKYASLKYDYGARPWTKVTGVCLHQTACEMGLKPERYDAIGAHFVVLRDGRVLWMHDLDRLIVHGNGWNAQCVGIEIDGLYAGIEGDPRTVWNDPSTKWTEAETPPTEAALEATHLLVTWIKQEVERHGGTLTALVAHRQSSNSRESDPGSAIWSKVAVPLHAELGLTDGGVGFTIGNGLPIPEAWDPRCKGIRYR